MEKRRGESSDVWMKNTGEGKKNHSNESFFTKAEAIQAAQKSCDEHGIDPTLDPQERITRYIDIMHGSPHTGVEKDLMTKYQLALKG